MFGVVKVFLVGVVLVVSKYVSNKGKFKGLYYVKGCDYV